MTSRVPREPFGRSNSGHVHHARALADLRRVTHAHTANELVALGQDTERLVLSRVVRAWAEDRNHLIGNDTIVFS